MQMWFKTDPEKLPYMLSVYLDLVRFGAALAVALSHAWPVLFPAFPLSWPGHSAVVVFFVLSGFVISHATSKRGVTLGDYANHRLSRIYSVAIPALLLSGLTSALLGGQGLGDMAPAPDGWLDGCWKTAANLFFVGQIWLVQAAPPLNPPFWSLNFEVWYYALFGAWSFLEGSGRAITVLILVTLAGPKILLLFPDWLLGVLLYRFRPRLSEQTALAVFVLTVLLGLAFIKLNVSIILRQAMVARWPDAMSGLGGANQFVGDWLLGLIIVTNFASAASLGRFAATLRWPARAIRSLASYTFSLYLYHVPFLAFAVIGLKVKPAIGLLIILLGVAALAHVSEFQLPAVRRLFRGMGVGGRPRAINEQEEQPRQLG